MSGVKLASIEAAAAALWRWQNIGIRPLPLSTFSCTELRSRVLKYLHTNHRSRTRFNVLERYMVCRCLWRRVSHNSGEYAGNIIYPCCRGHSFTLLHQGNYTFCPSEVVFSFRALCTSPAVQGFSISLGHRQRCRAQMWDTHTHTQRQHTYFYSFFVCCLQPRRNCLGMQISGLRHGNANRPPCRVAENGLPGGK